MVGRHVGVGGFRRNPRTGYVWASGTPPPSLTAPVRRPRPGILDLSASVLQPISPPWRPEQDFSAQERRSALLAPETLRFHRSTATFSLWATSERRSAPKVEKCTFTVLDLHNRPVRRWILTFSKSDFCKKYFYEIFSKIFNFLQSAFETVNTMVSGRLFRPKRKSSLKSHFFALFHSKVTKSIWSDIYWCFWTTF